MSRDDLSYLANRTGRAPAAALFTFHYPDTGEEFGIGTMAEFDALKSAGIIDPYAAQWLRNLIAAGHLPAGDVDERSIVDIQPEDLNGYGQCHFFAGIGVWPYALGRNGWGQRANLWTGSCPCQPFSAAGRQLGFDDERHLWPAWFHLITQRRPAIVLGEQVSSALAWLDLISDDLESAGYAVGASDLCAAGFPVENWGESPQHQWLLRAIYDCPDPLVAAELLDFAAFAGGNLGAHDGDHIRQRLYFVGMAQPQGEHGGTGLRDSQSRGNGRYLDSDRSGACGVEHADNERRRETRGALAGERQSEPSAHGRMAHGEGDGRREECANGSGSRGRNCEEGRAAGFGAGGSHIGMVDPSNAGSFSGAYSGICSREESAGAWDGEPKRPSGFDRVGRLRAYGNALDAETVTAFIAAVRECAP